MRAAIVVAGGTGERVGLRGGKQLVSVAGAPVVTHALRAFDASPSIDTVVLVCPPDRVEEFRRDAVEGQGIVKVRAVVAGGKTRALSVRAGLDVLADSATIVAVHDGARPLVQPEVIERAVRTLENTSDADGVAVGHPSYDTVKVVGEGLRVVETPDRSTVWMAQTPQVFRLRALLEAHTRSLSEGWEVTDDASLVELAGGTVVMIEGPRWNIKVTVREDLDVVADILRRRERGGSG